MTDEKHDVEKAAPSSQPRDFSWSETPLFLFTGIVVSAVFMILGMTVKALPPFWGWVFYGIGCGLFTATVMMYGKKPVDIAELPEPSDAVRAKCDDPEIKLADAAKLYCEETGASISDAITVLRAYREKQPR